MKIVILSGGSGSRLWPVSRESYPKQFCEFFDKSFLRDTVERLKPVGDIEIVTLHSMATLTASAVAEVGVGPEKILLEPLAKNTAPAIALVAQRAMSQGEGDSVIGVFPADHLITNVDRFHGALRLGEDLASKDEVVTIGIEPRYAATGYGYLEVQLSSRQTSAHHDVCSYKVARFVEKPTQKVAESYVQSKNYFWNAGIFLFKVRKMAELLSIHMPDLWRKMSLLKPDLSNLKSIYSNILSESIDYGVMEKLKGQIVCIPGDFGWSDVGSWDELARLHEEKIQIDSKAHIFTTGSTDNFVYSSHNKVIGLCGIENLIVVDTPDALLVSKRGASQDVKKLVESMRESQMPQVIEHNFEVRPWGRFEILADHADHKVKRLILDPKKQMSYQVHEKRDEHWVVISGEAQILMGEKSYHLSAGQQIFAPRGQKHRIRNMSDAPLVIVEVQTGQYFGEDDITRIEDDFNRV